MTTSLDFYFDFSSPYGYLASEWIDVLAEKYGRAVVWRPVLLGILFKSTGSAPLAQIPLKGAYSLHDFARSARYLGVDYRQPTDFPIATHHAAPPKRDVTVRDRRQHGHDGNRRCAP